MPFLVSLVTVMALLFLVSVGAMMTLVVLPSFVVTSIRTKTASLKFLDLFGRHCANPDKGSVQLQLIDYPCP